MRVAFSRIFERPAPERTTWASFPTERESAKPETSGSSNLQTPISCARAAAADPRIASANGTSRRAADRTDTEALRFAMRSSMAFPSTGPGAAACARRLPEDDAPEGTIGGAEGRGLDGPNVDNRRIVGFPTIGLECGF